MAKRIVEESSLIGVADAIRNKSGTNEQLVFPDGFVNAISSIDNDGVVPEGTIYITENNRTFDVTEYAEAEVNIQIEGVEEVKLQSKSVSPNATGSTVEPDSGYTGLSKVTISGDSDLKAENIKKNVNIFGVTGTYEGSGSSSGDIVYGENIEVDSLSELHSWNKYLASGTTTKTDVTDVLLGSVIQTKVITVEYADKTDTSSGYLALSTDGHGTIDISSDASANTLKGKAVRIPGNNGYFYYEIPTTATIDYSSNANSAQLRASQATRVTYVSGGDEFVGIVVSEDSSAYPQNGEQDGYKYVYNGTLDAGSCDHTSVTQATPVISVDSSGKITATSTQSAGLVSAGTKTATKTDSNLVASNIKSGVTIFNVTGSYTGSGSTTSCNHTSVTQATPTISVNASTGVITASATQSAGLVSAGTKSATTQITHTNLTADNIKKGVQIFNITGNYEGSGCTHTSVTQATPVISVDSSGKITATSTQSAGLVSAGTKTATKTDSNLVASNIKSGVTIFNVTGSYTGSGISGDCVAGWTVEDVSGASYGFVLQDDGYYKSQNGGVINSAALCKVKVKVNGTCNMYIDCICSGEGQHDYGILSKINSDLLTSNSADSSYENVIKGTGVNEYNLSRTIVYKNVSSDSHITIKYRKDSSSDKGADCLRFKVRLELASSSSNLSSETLVIDNGITTTSTFTTGLSEIASFRLTRQSPINVGLVDVTITPSFDTGRVWGISSVANGGKTYTSLEVDSSCYTITGGTVSWNGVSDMVHSGFAAGESYEWQAIGYA